MTAAVGLDASCRRWAPTSATSTTTAILDIYLGTGSAVVRRADAEPAVPQPRRQAFVDVTAATGTGDLQKGHGVAFADLDSDGDRTIIFGTSAARARRRAIAALFENPGHAGELAHA